MSAGVLLAGLACPCCGAPLPEASEQGYLCANCGGAFPVVDGRPILINDANSVFAIGDYTGRTVTIMGLQNVRPPSWAQRLKSAINRMLPDISYPASDFSLEAALDQISEAHGGNPRVLVIGAGEAGLRLPGGGQILYTDVALGPHTHLVCDSHDIPFAAEQFDAVLAIAVLEHVADPNRCVEEIHRVLKPQGHVYAITPFMQQVHLSRYDFTRFTHLGHRRLFRRFSELRSGVANGPAMALAWSFERFLASFATSRSLYAKLRTVARLIIFPVKYFDAILARRPAAYDCASSYYFYGRKSDSTLSDRELIRLYRGMGHY